MLCERGAQGCSVHRSNNRTGVVLTVIVGLFCFQRLPSASVVGEPPITKDVPLSILLGNLQDRLEKEPSNFNWLYASAWICSLIYLGQTTGQEIEKTENPGMNPMSQQGLPYLNALAQPWDVEGSTPTVSIRQGPYLVLAADLYRRALSLDPLHVNSTMGLAWCNEHIGDREKAIKFYLRANDLAWELESKHPRVAGRKSVVLASGEAIVRLLGSCISAQEFARIQQRQKKLLSLREIYY